VAARPQTLMSLQKLDPQLVFSLLAAAALRLLCA
jgi:hypothetical protein